MTKQDRSLLIKAIEAEYKKQIPSDQGTHPQLAVQFLKEFSK